MANWRTVLIAAALLASKATKSSPLRIRVVTRSTYQPDGSSKDDETLKPVHPRDRTLQLKFAPKEAEEIVTPLNIVVDDLRVWRWLAESEKTKSSAAHGETTAVEYGLAILNDKLPAQLVNCYSNMTKEHLEKDVYSPAAYGDRLCGNLVEAEHCVGNMSRNGRDIALLEFTQEMEHIKAAICDPECPFAQAESCKTSIVNSTNVSNSCSISGALSCADAILDELKCAPKALAVIYWKRTKMLAQLTHCHLQTKNCLADSVSCLSPFSDYLTEQNVEKLCLQEGKIQYCIASITSCGFYAHSELLESSNQLLNQLCHQVQTTSQSTTTLDQM